ncbi:hypothetical protein GCM10008955_07560 [Deinococcus malanensis]|uniref:Uncharacterized protein n=1 Tax=Deinococcus malanensis TaxID=1706855 RepID=A0ABQ2ELT4_9DEIO|nr:hypothetical protein [Deinococcus malanensis]GGK16634.1 hypothetical protein GCM10008955_07560 [Deinococcus malanensis]
MPRFLALPALVFMSAAQAAPASFQLKLATPPGTQSIALVTHPAQAIAQNVTAGPGGADPKAEFTVESDGCLSYSYFANPGSASRYGRKDLCGFTRSGLKVKVVNTAPKLGQWTVVAYLTSARGQQVPLRILASVTPWKAAAPPTLRQVVPPLNP